MAKMFYASVASDGAIRHVGGFKETVESAVKDFGRNVLIEKVAEPARSNPAGGTMDLNKVLRRTQIIKSTGRGSRNGKPYSHAEVCSMSLEEAWARVHPFFFTMAWWNKKKKSWQYGSGSRTYQSPKLLASSFLGSNYKMEKHKLKPSKRRDVERHLRPKQLRIYKETPDSSVYGLTLTPYSLLQKMPSELRYSETFTDMLPLIRQTNFVKGFSLCAGSNTQCQDGCLTFAGHNWMVQRNAKVKIAKTLALIHEPLAFIRLLYEGVHRFLGRKGKSARFEKYIRMNVLSDIPWELICPWLFRELPKDVVRFYDYTKVSGRKTPSNYDITFSFSGTNTKQTIREMERGRRVAMVFLAEKRKEYKTKADTWVPVSSRAHAAMPKKFRLPGQEKWHDVWDGDAYDMRPLDDKRVYVGLRWKTPLGQDVDPTTKEFNFVTPCFLITDTESSLSRPNPRSRAHQWLVAPVTPRYTPFEYQDNDAIAAEAMRQLHGVVPVDIEGELGI